MKRILLSLLAVTVVLSGCDPVKKINRLENRAEKARNKYDIPEAIVESPVFDKPEEVKPEIPSRPVYRAARLRQTDVIHMNLEVSFDWKKQHLHGKALLDVKQHFYPADSVFLDAKGMDIHEVSLVVGKAMQPLKYHYDGLLLRIKLDRMYKKDEKTQLYITYTARPNEFISGGSAAINSDKGLYFINPDSATAGKPTQIWTQGETEANSRWFPTVDSPNEKITHDIHITVDKKYLSLSNGLLISSKPNKDGTRTDHWRQDLPHAPYLVMMTIGDFAVVKDSWTRKDGSKMEVNYYVEKEYEAHAKAIFGDTPEMLTYFSNLLGVEYPWAKYHQVIVRDYVSGAMENTSAVIHGEFFNQTTRELIDNNNFSTIAHELFHHWFGDLVTCESWANLPLNESFANYSQYLWDEYKYGIDEADYQAESEKMGYIYTAQQGMVDMIRFNYGDKEEMFDGNSYNKGGRILHMLRRHLGDEAFFGGLKLYLEKRKFNTAEIHDLRMAFEEVSGEDLNWFFNDWFLNKGHALLNFDQAYNNGELTVTITQKQDFSQVPLYRLPIAIDIYVNGKATRHKVFADEVVSVFKFKTSEPELVVIDVERCVLAEITEKKPHEQYIRQFYLAPLYADRKEAVEKCAKKSDDASIKVVVDALDDKFWGIRALAIKSIRKAARSSQKDAVRNKLKEMALKDPNSTVRRSALATLYKEFDKADDLAGLSEAALKDQSYLVMSTALELLSVEDPSRAFKLAAQLENEQSSALMSTIAGIYAESGTIEQHPFFLRQLPKVGGFDKIGFIKTYIRFVKRLPYTEIDKAIPVLTDMAVGGGSHWGKYFGGYQELQGLVKFYNEEAEAAKTAGNASKAADAEKRAEDIKALIKELLSKETNAQVLQFMGQ
jgi:aminopeptidase N